MKNEKLNAEEITFQIDSIQSVEEFEHFSGQWTAYIKNASWLSEERKQGLLTYMELLSKGWDNGEEEECELPEVRL